MAEEENERVEAFCTAVSYFFLPSAIFISDSSVSSVKRAAFTRSLFPKCVSASTSFS